MRHLDWFSYPKHFRSNIEQYVAAIRETRGEIPVVVELNEQGIALEWSGILTRLSWPAVRVIDDADDYVEVSGPMGAVIVVPNRAFEDESERSTFLACARTYRAEFEGALCKYGHRNCPECGYDVFGAAGEHCPECGNSIPTGQQAPQRIHPEPAA